MLEDSRLLDEVQLVQKPFTAVQLMQAVRHALDARAETPLVIVSA